MVAPRSHLVGPDAPLAPDLGRSPAPLTVEPEKLAAMVRHLRDAGSVLEQIPIEDRIAAIDRAAATWLAGSSPWRWLALERLPASTRYPPAALRQGLDHLWGALRAPSLRAAVEREGFGGDNGAGIDDRLAGDGINGTGDHPARPRFAVHVLAGNVPGVGVFGMVAGLLAGVPGLVKTASREPFLPELVARSLVAEDPRLAAGLAVVHWSGGSTAHERIAFSGADLVIAYGRSESLDAVAAYEPRRLLRFGPRMSVAVVAREACTPATAANAAFQIALFDQQGCLSPQLVVVEEGRPADHFAAALAAELMRLAETLPAAPLTLAESTAVWRFLERQRWRAQEGASVTVHTDVKSRFSVVCDRSAVIQPSPLHRHVVVVPVASLADACAPLSQFVGLIETLGYAGPERRTSEAAALAERCGAHRLCPLERMQAPPFAWCQGGYARLASFFSRPSA